MSELKLCKDCKHHGYGGGKHWCDAETKTHTCPVTGGPDYRYQIICVVARADSFSCGADGKLFEAKPVKLSLRKRFCIWIGSSFHSPR